MLITGANGYLGSHLCALLGTASDCRVSAMVRSSAAAASLSNSNNVEPFLFDLLTGDESELRSAMQDVDSVVHLAASDAAQCSADPLASVAVNIGGTVRLAEAARRANIRRFVYLSTIHVYGSSVSGVVTEETLDRPVHAYSISHRAAEDFVLMHGSGWSPVVLRLSNACGPPLSDHPGAWELLINDLCRQAVTDRRLVLRTPGFRRRDFVPVTDAVRGIWHALELPTGAVQHRVFNVGGNTVLTVRQAAELVASRCHVVLGFLPEIFAPAGNDAEHPGLDCYQCDRFEQTGFVRQSTLLVAVDECLAAAVMRFSPHSVVAPAN